MTEEKRNRLVAAITVNVILLVVILAAVVIFQLAVITSASQQRTRMAEEIAEYDRLVKEGESRLDWLKSNENLRDLAVEYGYKVPQ